MAKQIVCPACNGYGFVSVCGENSIGAYTCDHCNGAGKIEVPMTNADRIRAMSDEELAVFVRAVIMAEDCPVTGCDCDKCFFKEPCFNGSKWYGKETEWLKQPAEGE